MAKVLVKVYAHRDKESNFDLVDKFNNEKLKYVGYEVELLVEIDTETGDHKIVGCEGQFLDELDYQNVEITKV